MDCGSVLICESRSILPRIQRFFVPDQFSKHRFELPCPGHNNGIPPRIIKLPVVLENARQIALVQVDP